MNEHPFVGREEQLAELKTALIEGARGRGTSDQREITIRKYP